MAKLKSKQEFKFNSRSYLNSVSYFFNWDSVRVSWEDFDIVLDKQSGFQFEGGGLLKPLSRNKLVYQSVSGRCVIIPARAKAYLSDIIDDIESGRTSDINIKVEGIRGKFKIIWGRIKSVFNRAN